MRSASFSAIIITTLRPWTPVPRRRTATLLFDETGFADRLLDRDHYADRVVRTFRGRSDAYLSDPVAIEMVDALSRRSPPFKTLCERHDVRRAETDTLQANHPGGRLRFTMTTWQAVATPGVRFSAYLPADEQTSIALKMGS